MSTSVNASPTNLSTRLNGYKKASAQIVPAAAVAATASWSVVFAPQEAAAVVNTFSLPFGSQPFNPAGPGSSTGGNSNGWFLLQSTFAFKINASVFNSSLNFVGSVVPPGAPISPSTNTPSLNSVSLSSAMLPVPPGTIFPLRYIVGADDFFGWLRIDPAGYTVGFSDIANGTVLAGTTTDFGAPAVPEPSTAIPLLLLGAAGVAMRRRKAAQAE